MKIKYNIEQKDIGKSINDILKNNFDISIRLLTKLIKQGKIKVNDSECDTRNTVKLGDRIEIDLDFDEESQNIVPTKMSLDIIYEDEWLLVVNKPAGVPIHPSMLHYTDSLSNGVKYYFNLISLNKKIRPVNRLDLGTSGIVIFAKSEYIQESFIKQMEKGIFEKEYFCLVEGILDEKKGTISLPIARKPGSIIERCIDTVNGKRAITHYEVVKEFDTYSLVKCKLETGRTHQIRVHFASIGHPLIGDTLYGKESKLISRQALHSYSIKCIHPITKENMTFISKLPKDMTKQIEIEENGEQYE